MSAVQELFAPYGDVEVWPGREINAATVATADVLLVRSVTRVDKQLLEGSSVQFVGSATIGTDHIDLKYLQESGIHFAYAPGCNAEAVVQYMFSVFCTLEPQWREKSVGIIGCGNVGGRLLHRLSALGVACHVYDPFLKEIGTGALTSLETALGADIVCLHTPLTRQGPHPTHHMIHQQVLEQRIRPGTLLINASRGGVIDNPALLAHLKAGAELKVALDVWEGEPEINLDLLRQADIATPHIAGYSLEGRLRGTQMVRDAMCLALDLDVGDSLNPLTEGLLHVGESDSLFLNEDEGLAQAILASYQVAEDDRQMHRALVDEETKRGESIGALFDGLRKHYAQRREFSYYNISGPGKKACCAELELLGFNTT